MIFANNEVVNGSIKYGYDREPKFFGKFISTCSSDFFNGQLSLPKSMQAI